MRCDFKRLFIFIFFFIRFNPYWVFQCAATRLFTVAYKFRYLRFNPYWVFQCAATRYIMNGCTNRNKFQSLLGFPMRCDLFCCKFAVVFLVMFQSLLGFPMRCDFDAGAPRDISLMFQSLLGFPMRCDQSTFFVVRRMTKVSIPIGFSNALRRVNGLHTRAVQESFNPYWVFQCAATALGLASASTLSSFNPYWVFQCAATRS